MPVLGLESELLEIKQPVQDPLGRHDGKSNGFSITRLSVNVNSIVGWPTCTLVRSTGSETAL